MKNELEVKHTGEATELIIREGDALPLKEPVIINIIATITGVLLWLEKRVSEIVQKSCHILVDKDNLKFTLIVNELCFYKTTITSKLEFSKIFKDFGINDSKTWSCFKLSDFIKMNRAHFLSVKEAMDTVTLLRKFEATVNQELKQFKDDHANYEFKKAQTVESNLPKELKVAIPIFKGMDKVTLTLEIVVDPSDFSCSFICPEANDFVINFSDKIIEEQLTKIKEIAPDIAIIYQ